jgi:hypothetical protein
MRYLTKTAIAEFEQCDRRFWLARHRPELAQSGDSLAFSHGRQIGAIARRLLPDGVEVAAADAPAALSQTAQLLAAPAQRPIFEAAFLHDQVLVRVDLLLPADGAWRLVEVKSSASVKVYQLSDIATQAWVAAGAGLPLAGEALRLVDTTFVYPGGGRYEGLLRDFEVGDQIAPLMTNRPGLAAAAQAVAQGGEPQTTPGAHCAAPFACPFTSYCWADLPPEPEFPVSLLPGAAGKALAASLAQEGYEDLRQVPAARLEAPLHGRIHAATLSDQPFHDRAACQDVVASWAFPRSYLDFETISHAAPPWPGTRPYQTIPFQFSCHREEADGRISHVSFLDLSGEDPSGACAEALLGAVGEAGAIISYNAGFERRCILDLAQRFPDLAPGLRRRAARLVDALPMVRAHYYHRNMRGSFSIKAVLPAVVPSLSYGDLDGVKDGLAAQVAYLEATAPQTSPQRRQALAEQLEAYCTLDTLAMVELVHALTG